jgi:hypothetical protein
MQPCTDREGCAGPSTAASTARVVVLPVYKRNWLYHACLVEGCRGAHRESHRRGIEGEDGDETSEGPSSAPVEWDWMRPYEGAHALRGVMVRSWAQMNSKVCHAASHAN